MPEVACKPEKWVAPSLRRKWPARTAESHIGPAKHRLHIFRYETLSPKCVRLVETTRTGVVGVGAESGATTPGYVQTAKKLVELLELPGGWNSYNAKPITRENVSFALSLLAEVMRRNTPMPHVVPKVRGGVRLEWHRQGMDIEIDIDSPERVSFFADNLQGTEEPVEQALDVNVLAKWVGQLSL